MTLDIVGIVLGFTFGYLGFLWEKVGIELLTQSKKIRYTLHEISFGGIK